MKYLDVVSGGEEVAIVVRILGSRDARIEPPMMIFRTKVSNYSIREMPDDVPVVFIALDRKDGFCRARW